MAIYPANPQLPQAPGSDEVERPETIGRAAFVRRIATATSQSAECRPFGLAKVSGRRFPAGIRSRRTRKPTRHTGSLAA
jgi:hypothetical protein